MVLNGGKGDYFIKNKRDAIEAGCRDGDTRWGILRGGRIMAAEYWWPVHAHVIDHIADDGGGILWPVSNATSTYFHSFPRCGRSLTINKNQWTFLASWSNYLNHVVCKWGGKFWIKLKLNCSIKILWDWLCLRHQIRPLAEAETCGSIISFRLTDRSIVGVIFSPSSFSCDVQAFLPFLLNLLSWFSMKKNLEISIVLAVEF